MLNALSQGAFYNNIAKLEHLFGITNTCVKELLSISPAWVADGNEAQDRAKKVAGKGINV